MSRPSTRSKTKSHNSEDHEGSSSEILRKFHLTKEISRADIQHLYLISKPTCQGCRSNSKDSPNCFCGLIPCSSNTRRAGLWQKISDIIKVSGPDPCQDLRSTGFPAGLTNLGATCYANSILQCLYMNSLFREGLFSVELELLEQQPVLDQLARLFAHLHSSRMAFVDSAAFIKTLELDSASQQDSHEFFTLFLSLLEQSLSRSKVPKARTVVQDLFRGSISHVTRCSLCGQESKASSKLEDFYELELNVKGFKNLDESLDDYLSVEELHGENQYFCESCGTRVDATRSIKLHTLPQVLSLQLKRYVFLPKTTTKKKLTSVFSFPQCLNMSGRVSNPSEMGIIYDLSAILAHRGTAVNSGHYVAHIKDEFSGHWWEFDDEHVTELGVHPFGEETSSSIIEGDKNVKADYHKGSLVNENHHNTTCSSKGEYNTINDGGMFSSADAYMLIYRYRCSKPEDHMDVDRSNRSSPPCHLSKEIDAANSLFIAACDQYKLRKEKEVEIITQRRHEVKLLLSEAAVGNIEDPFFWVSTDWLHQWSDSVNPHSIDNTQIQCSHGKVPLSKVGFMKRVSEVCWQKIITKYGGGPELTGDDYCIACLENAAKTLTYADSYRSHRSSMKELAEAALAGNYPDESRYYVPRAWLLQWLRRKNIDAPCEADAGPTASLQCPHGALIPLHNAGVKRILVPESFWHFLVESSKAARPDDLSGCLAFPESSQPCAVCLRELSEMTCLEDVLRETKQNLRRNHENLFSGKKFTLDLNSKYYLLPLSWLTKWRAYVTTSGKNFTFSAEPENLNVVMDSLKCEKHMKLLLRPPELRQKRGMILQQTLMDGLTLVTDDDWKLFCEEWNVPPYKGLPAEIDFPNLGASKMVGCSNGIFLQELPVDLASEESVEGKNQSAHPVLKTYPEICEVCIGERETCMLMQKRNYFNEEIHVVFVCGREPPRYILEDHPRVPLETERRGSKRSRKTAGCNSVSLNVSGTTSIYQLKLMIWEMFGIVKENQKLHKGSKEIFDESATLASLNIFPGDVLWVRDSEIHENRDIADELSEEKMEHVAERGFRGTLLSANIVVKE